MSNALFVARRLIVRERTRTLAAMAVAAGVIFILTAGLVSLSTMAPSAAQKNAGYMSADVDLTLGLLNGDTAKLRAARHFAEGLMRQRYGAATRFDPVIQAVGIEVSRASNSTDAGAAAAATYYEFDARRLDPVVAYALVSGRYPRAPGEVTVSPALAAQLHVGLGSRVALALSTKPVTVVGISRVREVHSTPLVLAGAGTWAARIAGAPAIESTPAIFCHLYVTVPEAARRLLSRDFVAGSASVPYVASLQHHSIFLSGSRAEPTRGFRAFWVKNTVVFTVPIVALLATIVIGQCLLRMRRDVHMIGSLGALGFTRRQTTAVLALGSLVPTVVGVVFGCLAGLLATLPWRTQIAALADTDPSTTPPPWAAMVVGILLFVAVSAAGIAALASRAAGQSGLLAESVQFVERPAVQRSLVPLFATGGLLAAATAGWWFVKPADGGAGLVRAVLSCATLIAVVPAVAVTLGRTIPPARLSWWLAARVARTEVARMIGIVAIAGLGLGAPLGLLMAQSSYAATAIASYHPSSPAGQVVVVRQRPLAPAAARLLDHAAGAEAVVQPQVRTRHGDEVWASPNPRGRFGPRSPAQLTVVADRADAAVDLGWSMPDADWRAVARGEVLWLDRASAPRDGTVTFTTYDDEARPHVLAHAPAVLTAGTPASTALHDGGAVMSRATAERLGFDLVPFWRRYPDAVGHVADITRAATLVGVGSTDVRTDPGPMVLPVPMSFKTALALGLALVGIGVFLILAPTGRESRSVHLTLHALGSAPRSIRRLHLITTMTPLLLGCGVGVVAGIGVFFADLRSASSGVAHIPWGQVATATAGVLLVGVSAIAASCFRLLAGPVPRSRSRG